MSNRASLTHWFAPDDDRSSAFRRVGHLVFGATFQGTATQARDDEVDHAWTHYRQRFPFVDARWSPAMIATGAIDSRIYKITPTVFRTFDETLNIPGNILQIRP